MAAAGIKPDIEDIELLPEIVFSALGADRPLRQQLCGTMRIPCIRSLLCKDGGDVVDNIFAQQNLVTGFAVKRNDRHAPRALA